MLVSGMFLILISVPHLEKRETIRQAQGVLWGTRLYFRIAILGIIPCICMGLKIRSLRGKSVDSWCHVSKGARCGGTPASTHELFSAVVSGIDR
jgi:hypothetical protein